MTNERKIPGSLARETKSIELGGSSEDCPIGHEKPLESGEHNVVTSLLKGGWHAPVLDIDIPHELVPSTTPGHSHLYLDVAIPWDKYCELLVLLAEVGIIEEGYVNAALQRGYTTARLPWVKKPTEDAPDECEVWMDVPDDVDYQQAHIWETKPVLVYLEEEQ